MAAEGCRAFCIGQISMFVFEILQMHGGCVFFSLQGKALKEIYAILTETLACFLPGRVKDLSAPLTA